MHHPIDRITHTMTFVTPVKALVCLKPLNHLDSIMFKILNNNKGCYMSKTLNNNKVVVCLKF